MKKVQIFKASLALCAVMFLAACSSSTEKADVQSEVNVTYTDAVSEDGEKYVASLAIDGMACEMMCGNKISSTLASINGVKHTEIEFNGAEEDNFAIVEYDVEVVSEGEMVKAVEALANGHYKVKSVEVVHYKKGEATLEVEKELSYTPHFDYELPNIFGAFARLF